MAQRETAVVREVSWIAETRVSRSKGSGRTVKKHHSKGKSGKKSNGRVTILGVGVNG